MTFADFATRIGKDARWSGVLKIAIVLLNVAIVLGVLNVTMVMSATNLYQSRWWVVHTLDVQVTIRQGTVALLDAESNQRTYLITGDPMSVARYRRAAISCRALVHKLAILTVDNAAQQEHVHQLAAALERKIRFLDACVASRDRGEPATEIDFSAGHRLILRIRGLFDLMDEEERRLYEERSGRLTLAIHRIYAGLFVILGKDAVLLALLISAFVRAVRSPDRGRGDAALRGIIESI